MKQLENIQVSDMKHILSHLKQYDDMTKKLGSRGKKLFQKTLSGEKSFVVEYFSALGEDEAYNQSLTVFQKSFGATPERTEILFLSRDDLKGGMKVYCDDNMVDMSYKKIENLLQR